MVVSLAVVAWSAAVAVARFAMAWMVSSLNTLSGEFEEQAQKKLGEFNKAGAMLDATSRKEILDLIEKEIRGDRAGDADSAAQQQSSTIESSQKLLRRLFRYLT